RRHWCMMMQRAPFVRRVTDASVPPSAVRVPPRDPSPRDASPPCLSAAPGASTMNNHAPFLDLPDGDLVPFAVARATGALDTLVDRCIRPAFRIAAATLRPHGKASPAAVEEVAWDGLEAMVLGLETFDGTRGKFQSWLAAVVRNAA